MSDKTKPPPLYGEPVQNSTRFGSPWSINLKDDYDGRYWLCHGDTPEECIAHAWDLVDAFADPVVAAELRRLAESENIPWQVTSLEREPSCGDLREAVQEWLRQRANELDPSGATPGGEPT